MSDEQQAKRGAAWSDDVEAFVIEMWEGGTRAANISNMVERRFGVRLSRNAIIGRMHRLGIGGGSKRTGRSTPQRGSARSRDQDAMRSSSGVGGAEHVAGAVPDLATGDVTDAEIVRVYRASKSQREAMQRLGIGNTRLRRVIQAAEHAERMAQKSAQGSGEGEAGINQSESREGAVGPGPSAIVTLVAGVHSGGLRQFDTARQRFLDEI